MTIGIFRGHTAWPGKGYPGKADQMTSSFSYFLSGGNSDQGFFTALSSPQASHLEAVMLRTPHFCTTS